MTVIRHLDFPDYPAWHVTIPESSAEVSQLTITVAHPESVVIRCGLEWALTLAGNGPRALRKLAQDILEVADEAEELCRT